MFPTRMFPGRMFAARMFAKTGSTVAVPLAMEATLTMVYGLAAAITSEDASAS